MNLARAAEYAARHRPQALFVVCEGATLFEAYADGYDARTPHPLYSGSKSFWGIAAVAARDDGLLSLDEPVGDTFATWAHGARAAVTLRQLLQLTSGIGFGGLGNAVPTSAKALAVTPSAVPGTRFTYGGIPLQIFGAVLAEKLRPRGLTPHEYLRERILSPIGLEIARWRTLADGTQPLPTGAFLGAAQWAKFGVLMTAGGSYEGRSIVAAASLRECFEGSRPNPRYGLGWWLASLADHKDVAYASGSGGQALYVLGRERAVIVRFGAGGAFKHETFLRHLLGAEEASRTVRKTRL